jgi:hypothetical protein
MPFKSEAQRRVMYAKEARGEVAKGTCARWEAKTPPIKLPQKAKPKARVRKAKA